MNRLMSAAMVAVVTALLSGTGIVVAQEASAEPDRRFASCRELRAVDPNGVAMTRKSVRQAVRQGFHEPLLCPVAYDANRRLDRDGDGIACERRR